VGVVGRGETLAQGVIDGYAAVTGTVDDGNDVIDRGEFTKTIAKDGASIRTV
jgi:phage head maturation protease